MINVSNITIHIDRNLCVTPFEVDVCANLHLNLSLNLNLFFGSQLMFVKPVFCVTERRRQQLK